jgi:ATP-dependent DNA helicase RecG
MVRENEGEDLAAAEARYASLKGRFGDDIVLVHGQMRPEAMDAAMERFAGGSAKLLVATTVIEVGVDVPNASLMVIEQAERFGLAQLHQLRGRVGRGEHASLCLLFGPAESKRLQALHQFSDGFKLAEIALELRGEGELTGTRQSGLARFRFALLPDDAAILGRARQRAETLLAVDPLLAAPEHVLLAAALAEREGEPVAA